MQQNTQKCEANSFAVCILMREKGEGGGGGGGEPKCENGVRWGGSARSKIE